MKHTAKTLLSNENPQGGKYSDLTNEEFEELLKENWMCLDNLIQLDEFPTGSNVCDYIRQHWASNPLPKEEVKQRVFTNLDSQMGRDIVGGKFDNCFRYPLFKLLSDEHSLTLLDSEMDEIINCVKQMLTKQESEKEPQEQSKPFDIETLNTLFHIHFSASPSDKLISHLNQISHEFYKQEVSKINLQNELLNERIEILSELIRKHEDNDVKNFETIKNSIHKQELLKAIEKYGFESNNGFDIILITDLLTELKIK